MSLVVEWKSHGQQEGQSGVKSSSSFHIRIEKEEGAIEEPMGVLTFEGCTLVGEMWTLHSLIVGTISFRVFSHSFKM